jgi:hypothetical protein
MLSEKRKNLRKSFKRLAWIDFEDGSPVVQCAIGDMSETGAKLQGTHLKLKDCDKCHTPSNTLPRAKGKSYLFKDSGCRSCHTPPHPGNQDKCVDCHNQESWIVERHGAEG